jgi:hypothetical protein
VSNALVNARLCGPRRGPGLAAALSLLGFTLAPAYACAQVNGDILLNPVLGPGQFSWDISIQKHTVVGGLREGADLELR